MISHPRVINFVLETFNAISEISRIYSRMLRVEIIEER